MASIPAVQALESRYGARGLRVVSVTKQGEDEEERERVAASAEEHGMDYPCFLDVDGSWSERAEASLIPVFMLLDGQGELAYRHAGKLEEGSEAFEALASTIERVADAGG